MPLCVVQFLSQGFLDNVHSTLIPRSYHIIYIGDRHDDRGEMIWIWFIHSSILISWALYVSSCLLYRKCFFSQPHLVLSTVSVQVSGKLSKHQLKQAVVAWISLSNPRSLVNVLMLTTACLSTFRIHFHTYFPDSCDIKLQSAAILWLYNSPHVFDLAIIFPKHAGIWL